MNEQNWSEAGREQTCYRTGFTQPKKAKRGGLALVLILVIFLSGLNTAFRLLDIRLFRNITKDAGIAPASVQFSAETGRGLADAPNVPALGISGKSISEFEHLYYDVPAGFYVTEVADGSPAKAAGLLPGDVLLYVNGHYTPDLAALEAKLSACSPGETVCLLLHRQNTAHSVEIRLDK